MRKIDKGDASILSKGYKNWVDKLEIEAKVHPEKDRRYYDDVAMNLYKCQQGVCAYTEMFICVPELYDTANWQKKRYKIPDNTTYERVDHLGEMDHFDPSIKHNNYWLWSNLFMIHSSINSRKSNDPVVAYLKPDLDNYSPEKYFDYDENTHRYIPNIEIEDEVQKAEIQNMIDKVLQLNHGVVKNERRDFIESRKQKEKNGTPFKIDRFFTATEWTLNGKPEVAL